MHFTKSTLCLFFLLGGLADPEETPNGPPRIPENCIYKPTYLTGYASLTGGTSFLCTIPNQDGVLMLTAQNIFGKDGGWPRDCTWEEVPKIFPAMAALSMTNLRYIVTSNTPLTITGAQAMDKFGYAHDLAAYRVDPTLSASALTLASVRPPIGSIVYLLARQHGKEALEMMRASVRKSTETEFEYVYFSINLQLLGTSGAPVLNQAGEVVAINIGGDIEHGRWGIGNPCTSIQQLLEAPKPAPSSLTPQEAN